MVIGCPKRNILGNSFNTVIGIPSLMESKDGPAKKSTAQMTRDYIESRPALRNVMLQGLVNYSALARTMMDEMGGGNEDAIVVALRRYVMEAGGEGKAALPDEAIMKILAESSLTMKTRVARITVRNDWVIMSRLEPIIRRLLASRVLLQIILGTEGITIITEHEAYKEITNVLAGEPVLRTRNGLAEVAVRCPMKIEETPGIVAHLASLLAYHGVNVVEMVSCYTDVIFIVEEADTMRTYALLKEHVGKE